MKPFLYIDKHHTYSPSNGHEFSYFSVSDARTNKNWIVQYNTIFNEILHYAMGYAEALNYDHNIYFSPNIDLENYPELDLLILTEEQFQNKRKMLVK